MQIDQMMIYLTLTYSHYKVYVKIVTGTLFQLAWSGKQLVDVTRDESRMRHSPVAHLSPGHKRCRDRTVAASWIEIAEK